MRQLAAVILFVGVFSLAAPAQSALPMIPPDAGLIVGIEWRRVMDSTLGGALTDQLKKSELSQVPALKGIQAALLHDLDSVLIAVPAAGLANSSKQPPALLIAKGRFAVPTLRALMAAKGQITEKYRTVELLVPPESSPKSGLGESRIAFLDANTIVAGDRAQVRAAIDRASAKPSLPVRAGLLEGAAELSGTNDIWMIVNVPANAAKDVPPAMSQIFSGVKSAALGMSFQDGLAVRINVRAKDETSAQSLAQAAQGLVAMAALGQDQASQASLETLRKIRIRPEGSQVKLELALDRAEFEKILKEAQTPRPPASAPASPAPAEPAKPKSIRISGLDSGPLEVPLSK